MNNTLKYIIIIGIGAVIMHYWIKDKSEKEKNVVVKTNGKITKTNG